MSVRPASVSVVIPTYNCDRYVTAAVDSVLAQTLPPAEIIVVDDGSTDRTAEVLRPYQGRIRYLYQQNQGEPAARNFGIRSAGQELIACLDADDLWLPRKLELQMAYLQQHPHCALVYTDTGSFDENGVREPSLRRHFQQTFAGGNVFAQLFRETMFGSGTVLFRKSCLEQVGWFDEWFLVGSDYEMWLRLARHFEFGFVDQPLLMYRQHASMSTRRLRRLAPDGSPWEIAVLKKILTLYPESAGEIGEKAINERFFKAYASYANDRLQNADHALARHLFAQALRYAPRRARYWLLYLLTFLTPSQVAGVQRMYRRLRALPLAKSPADAGVPTLS